MPPRDDGGDADDATDVERALIARLPPFLRRARAEDVARVATEVFGIGAKAAPLTSIEDVVRLLVRCEACGRVVLEDGLAAHALRRCDGGAAARDANANASAKREEQGGRDERTRRRRDGREESGREGLRGERGKRARAAVDAGRSSGDESRGRASRTTGNRNRSRRE